MKNCISIPYGVKTAENDVEILKEYTKMCISESEKLVCSSYDEEQCGTAHWYDKMHLGRLEIILDEICDILMDSVTYKPHLKLIAQIKTDLYTGNPEFSRPFLIEDVINDVAWQYFKKDEKVLERNENNPEYHFKYCVRKLRPMSNKLAKIIAENELDSTVFNIRGY